VPAEHVNKPSYLNSLGMAQQSQFEAFKERLDIEAAILSHH
jgi:hypothetical protein